MTRSTPGRLYQLRSKITHLAGGGQLLDVALHVDLGLLRGRDGAGSATTRKTRGLTRSVRRLIIPPLPAASRPSKMMTMRAPLAFTQACRWAISTCRRASSAS